MATNSNPVFDHVRSKWYEWEQVCTNLMLGYNEWRMRCYSETLLTLDCPWNEFKRWFDYVYSIRANEA